VSLLSSINIDCYNNTTVINKAKKKKKQETRNRKTLNIFL